VVALFEQCILPSSMLYSPESESTSVFYPLCICRGFVLTGISIHDMLVLLILPLAKVRSCEIPGFSLQYLTGMNLISPCESRWY
jgi:hypothetical protein